MDDGAQVKNTVHPTMAIMSQYPDSCGNDPLDAEPVAPDVDPFPFGSSVPPAAVVPLGNVPLITIVLVPLISATVITLLFTPL